MPSIERENQKTVSKEKQWGKNEKKKVFYIYPHFDSFHMMDQQMSVFWQYQTFN